MGFFGRKSKQPPPKPSEKGHEELLRAQVLTVKAKGNEFDDKILHHVDSAIKEGLSLYEEAMARQILSEVYLRQKRFKEAETEIKKALQLNERAPKKLNEMLYYSAWETLAAIYVETNRPDKAIGCYQQVVEQLPIRYGREEVKGILASAYCQMARIHLAVFEEQWGIPHVPYHLQKAIEHSLKAIEAYAEFPDTYEILGDIFGYEKWGRLRNPFYSTIEATKYYKRYLALVIEEEDRERVQKKLKNMM